MLEIYDKFGSPRSMAWLVNEFGNVQILQPPDPSPPYYRIAQLRENDDITAAHIKARSDLVGLQAIEAPAAIIVKVLDKQGNPLPNIDVAWWWPDAPANPGLGWHDHGVIGTTNANGDVGHAMGGGAYYNPEVTQGPHRTWIAGPNRSELFAGLGMIHDTNHRHIDVTYQQCDPPSPTGPDLNELLLLAEALDIDLIAAQAKVRSILSELRTHRCGGS